MAKIVFRNASNKRLGTHLIFQGFRVFTYSRMGAFSRGRLEGLKVLVYPRQRVFLTLILFFYVFLQFVMEPFENGGSLQKFHF